MLVDAHTLRLLKSDDPKQRRQAIVALAESRDPSALKHLAIVARTDLNPKLRELAVRAHKHLKETLEFASQVSATPAAVRTAEKEESQHARDYMDEATSMFIANQPAKAAASMLKALRANPNLKHDSYFRSLAGTIFNTTPDEGLAMLIDQEIDQERRGQFISAQKQEQAQRQKSQRLSQSSGIGWSAAWFDLAIYGVVIVIITFFILLVFSRIVIQSPIAYQLDPLFIGLFLIAALLNGVFSVVGMLIQGGVIHLVATQLLQGIGKLPLLLTQIVPFYSMMTVMTSMIFVLWGALTAFGSIEAGMTGAICSGPIIVLVSLFTLFKTADKIGKAYGFGVGKGCLSLLITSLLISLVTFVIIQGMLFSSGMFLRLHNLMRY